ncbi:MAG: valine--tRNA ligase, partial [Candidatus Omnitrophica bacterium]|nr:valine--tRNA ligase [Candidatus Omnitrophota bacterium]
ILQEYFSYLAPLANICKLSVSEHGIERPKHSAFGITAEANVYVLLEGVIELDKEKERLLKKADKLKKELDLARKKLNNKDFINKADDNVVAKVKESEAVLSSKITDILSIIESI